MKGFAGVLIGLVATADPAWGQASDVRLTTDRSIDCTSIGSIARDLFKDKRTDEEKAIAAWYFVRRQCFHWPHIPTWDSIDLINSYGFALCGHQSTILCQIWRAGGFKARLVTAPSHVQAEVYYGDGWHQFDCQVGWYALKKDKSSVASAEDMKADPSIILDAIRDGRASRPYFQCSDNPKGGVGWAAGHRPGGAPDVPAHRLVMNLRRGESITRSWGNEGKAWAPEGERTWISPHHGCVRQTVDANDPVNWPYWKPYAEDRGIKRSYGNGRMVYAPDLATDAFRDGLAEGGLQGVEHGKAGGLCPEEGKTGAVAFVIDVPYVIVDAWLEGTFTRRTEADAVRVLASADAKSWTPVWTGDRTGALASGVISLKGTAWARKRHYVKFELRGAAGLDSFRVTSVFMNNPQALPQLVPGRNEVTVAAAALGARPVQLRYEWEESGREKSLHATIDAVPFRAGVEVGGPDLPRMKSVTLAVDP